MEETVEDDKDGDGIMDEVIGGDSDEELSEGFDMSGGGE